LIDDAMTVGLISDTHGFWDDRIPTLFAGVDHILHAGDIGDPSILMGLERIAPVTAVMGNCDGPPLDAREIEVIDLAGYRFLVHHIVDPRAPHERLAQSIAHHHPSFVVFGHTHKSHDSRVDSIRYLNPGYAGRIRFNQPRSLAILDLADPALAMRWIDLGRG
jgi:putative phosphoesterase